MLISWKSKIIHRGAQINILTFKCRYLIIDPTHSNIKNKQILLKVKLLDIHIIVKSRYHIRVGTGTTSSLPTAVNKINYNVMIIQ